MSFVREGLAVMPNGVGGIHTLQSESFLKNVLPPPSHVHAPGINGMADAPAVNGTADRPAEEDDAEDGSVDLDILPRNVVCAFSVGCHLDLKTIAREGCNVQHKPTTNSVLMRIRHPPCTTHLWSSGKVTCTGSNSYESAKRAARKIARFLQKLGFPVRIRNYRVVNVMASCAFPFGVRLEHLANQDRENVSYEPELSPGANCKFKDLSASIKIFSSGNLTITAPSLENVQRAVERVYPVCSLSRTKKPSKETDAAVDIEDDVDNLDAEVGWPSSSL
jgi:transcription initiation factor TFIID TATA-box-binding protein